ncbi:hypothetical protein BBJ28_00000639, partial [Nothophytophthora sp. Chile5]
LLLPLLAALSVALTAMYVADVVSTKRFPSDCEMTYSWPVYTPVNWTSHPKYSLYQVDMQYASERLTGVPVLFLPGHRGSYKQARSLSRHLWDVDPSLFDVFALDFEQESSGLNGLFLSEQAAFVNDAVRAILRQYKRQNKAAAARNSKEKSQLVLPESVVIVAHSMGGVVARTAELLPNYKRRSIQHVIGLGVPYANPSFPFDTEMGAVYGRMHAKADDDVVYVSITGGHKDTLVHAPLSSVDSVAPLSRGFAALTAAMPTVQLPIDHFCLLWCHQLLKVVAQSLHAVVDLETRELLSDPRERLALAQHVLLDGDQVEEEGVGHAAVSNVSLHRIFVSQGYHTDEIASYGLLLPQFLTHLLRSRFMTLLVIMYALALQIFGVQIAQWQTRFNLQSSGSSSPEDVNQENFPSFTSMLHPIAHVPGAFKSGVTFVLETLRGGHPVGTRYGLSTTAMTAAAGTVIVAAVALFTESGKSETSKSTWLTTERLTASATTIAELTVLYLYALGLLYAFTMLLSVVQRFVLSPILSFLDGRTDGLRFRRWLFVGFVHAVVLVLGHIESFAPFAVYAVDPSRVLALVVLAEFAVFLLHLLALGGNPNGTLDQQRMNRSLFAVLWLSIFSWIGKIVYFAEVTVSPQPELSSDRLLEGSGYVVTLMLLTFLSCLSLDQMVPLPPTAFFGASSGQDAASVYGLAASSSGKSGSPVKITAENCPKCIFEDGGPGAILEEFSDQTTRRIVTGKTGEVVYTGPTFRVVSCDCVYRFQKSRDFCDFCIRSCRLCGGGNGNFQEAAKYKDFLEDSQMDLAMHALVAVVFQICAAVQFTYGLNRPYHLSFYLTPLCALALVVYHLVLRHPIEARRAKNKQRKKTSKATKKKKAPPSKATSKSKSEQNAFKTAENTSTTASKKKKKRKSGTSSASPLIEEVSAHS